MLSQRKRWTGAKLHKLIYKGNSAWWDTVDNLTGFWERKTEGISAGLFWTFRKQLTQGALEKFFRDDLKGSCEMSLSTPE